jgi:type I restriction enzyme, S subunit
VFPKIDYDSGFLTAFFLTPYAKHQILAQVYGGVVDHVDEDHIADVFCPNVPMAEQQPIGNLIRFAFESRDKANTLEDEAIAELEAIISG